MLAEQRGVTSASSKTITFPSSIFGSISTTKVFPKSFTNVNSIYEDTDVMNFGCRSKVVENLVTVVDYRLCELKLIGPIDLYRATGGCVRGRIYQNDKEIRYV